MKIQNANIVDRLINELYATIPQDLESGERLLLPLTPNDIKILKQESDQSFDVKLFLDNLLPIEGEDQLFEIDSTAVFIAVKAKHHLREDGFSYLPPTLQTKVNEIIKNAMKVDSICHQIAELELRLLIEIN